MAQNLPPLPPRPACPPGYKLLAWEGVGLFCPQRWDLGMYTGDQIRGGFRIDNDFRPVVQVQWWKTRGTVSLERVLAQYRKQILGLGKSPGLLGNLGKKRPQPGEEPPIAPLTDLDLPLLRDDPEQELQAFLIGPVEGKSEALVLWHHPVARRAAVFRFLIEQGEPAREQLRLMVRGLRLQALDQWREFSFYDVSLCCPPRWQLTKTHLSAGVCYLGFSRRFRYFALRRFSAANAVMGSFHPRLSELHTWCRVAYAAEFYDMNYNVEEERDEAGRALLRLRGGQRLLAPLEFTSLIPRHRKTPRAIDIIWDDKANKIYCLEMARLKKHQQAEMDLIRQSVHMTLREDCLAGSPACNEDPTHEQQWSSPRKSRMRALRARVRQGETQSHLNEAGRVVLEHQVERPGKLRLLGALGGTGAGPTLSNRAVELDLIGSMLWQKCDGLSRVCDLVELVRERFQISYREAEASVTQFVKALGNRGLLSVVLPEEGL